MDMEDVNRAVAVLPPGLRTVAIQEIARTGMSPALVAAIPMLVKQESGGQQFGPDGSVLKSPKGARGIFQIMPGTAGDLGINPDDPAQNVQGGIRYLAQMGERFKDPRLALAAYNAGPGAVQKAGGIPNIQETQDYVRKVGAELPADSYDVAAGSNQASDAYPAIPSAPKSSGLPGSAAGGASPTEQMVGINAWEREWTARAMSQPGLSKSGRAQAVDLVRKEAERRRSELKFQNTEAHYRESMDIQERNFRAREEARGITEEMRRAQADMKEQAASLKAEQSAAKDTYTRSKDRREFIGRLVNDAVPSFEADELGNKKPSALPGVVRSVVSSLDSKYRFQEDHIPRVVQEAAELASSGADAKDIFTVLSERIDAEWDAQVTASPEFQARVAAEMLNAGQGKLESEKDAAPKKGSEKGSPPEAPVTEQTSKKEKQGDVERREALAFSSLKAAPEPISSNVDPADVPQYLKDEKRYRDQRKGDLRLLRNVGIPTDSRSWGQVVDVLDRAFVRPTKDALTGAASLADTAIGLPIREAGRIISDAYERNFGETGHQNDIDMAIQAYESASPDVRAAMDVQARRKWGVTISELIQEHKKSRDKGAE
ncbi:hypothetical protein JCM15519_16770 [Fundidesulfovibrio butyratiphilus]